MTRSQPEAIALLVALGTEPDDARRLVGSAAGMNAALDVLMPNLGDEWSHNGWVVRRAQMLPFALLLAVTLALTVAGRRHRRGSVVDEGRAAMLDALAGLPRAPSAGQVPRRREAAVPTATGNPPPARPALYDWRREAGE